MGTKENIWRILINDIEEEREDKQKLQEEETNFYENEFLTWLKHRIYDTVDRELSELMEFCNLETISNCVVWLQH